jgi:hypothetical protein
MYVVIAWGNPLSFISAASRGSVSISYSRELFISVISSAGASWNNWLLELVEG